MRRGSDETIRCWCGSHNLADFSKGYARCAECGTLVSRAGLTRDEAKVRDDERDFYGKTYWLSHQRDVLGLPDIYERARRDLPERCLHWLRTLLPYALPPARVLEVGCGHAAFVALLRWAGFEATGLEVSPWVVDFARTTFEVPMLLGELETQKLPSGSFDVVVLNDVLEHLVDPLGLLRRCEALLPPCGSLLVQTPRYPDPETYEELLARNHPFLAMLQEREHLHLFSERAVRQLFEEAGLNAVRFETAFFPYDMFLLASRHPLSPIADIEREEVLLRTARSRMVKALLDIDEQRRAVAAQLQTVEEDRQDRIRAMDQQNEQVQRLSADYEERLKIILEQQGTIARLSQQIEHLSADYEARHKVISEQQLTVERLSQHIERLSADYEARLKVIFEQQLTIERLSQHIERLSADYEARLKVILEQQETIERVRGEWLRASTELESRQRDNAERSRTVALLEGQLASANKDAEAQRLVIAEQQMTIQSLVERARSREAQLEARLGNVEGRQGDLDALLKGRLVRLLRALKLL